MAEGQHNGQTNATSQNNDQKSICRKYIWGKCYKYSWCKFRHELVFEEMIKNLKFCHDFQNKISCTREDCTYLHSTREEEAHFKATGTMPRALAERHAAMAARDPMGPVNQGLVMNVASMAPPPPPAAVAAPPSPPVTTAPPLPNSAPPLPAQTYPMGPVPPPTVSMPSMPPVPPHPSMSASSNALPLSMASTSSALPPPIASTSAMPPPIPATLTALPPPIPPLPPIPPPTLPATTFPAPVYTPTAFSLPPTRAPVPTTIARFDVSKPPPPHTPIMSESGVAKRKISQLDAGAPNPKKPTSRSTKLCDRCVERIKRIENNQKRIETSIREEADVNLRYNTLLQPYNRKMALALSMVRPEKKKALEEYIEHGTTSGTVNNQQSIINQNVLLQLVEMLLTSSSRNYNAANNAEEAVAVVMNLVGPNVGNAAQAQPPNQESREAMVRTISDMLLDGNRPGATRDLNRAGSYNGMSKLCSVAATRTRQPAIMPAVAPFPAPPSSFPAPPSYFPNPSTQPKTVQFPKNGAPYPGTSGPFPAQAARFPNPPVPFSQSVTFSAQSGPYSAQSGPYSAQTGPYTAQGGSYTAQASSYTAQAGSYTAEAGSYTAHAGAYTAQAGPYTAQPGPYTAQAGPFTAQAGPFTSQAGPYTAQAGPYTAQTVPYSAQSTPYRPRYPPNYTQANGLHRPGTSTATYPTPPPTSNSYPQLTNTTNTSTTTSNGANQKPPARQYRSFQ